LFFRDNVVSDKASWCLQPTMKWIGGKKHTCVCIYTQKDTNIIHMEGKEGKNEFKCGKIKQNRLFFLKYSVLTNASKCLFLFIVFYFNLTKDICFLKKPVMNLFANQELIFCNAKSLIYFPPYIWFILSIYASFQWMLIEVWLCEIDVLWVGDTIANRCI